MDEIEIRYKDCGVWDYHLLTGSGRMRIADLPARRKKAKAAKIARRTSRSKR